MATLILGAVGYSLGSGLATGILGTALGVVGGYVGSRAGSIVDNALGIGPSRSVEGPRLDDLAVQSSAYGRAIPLIYGTQRVAGNVIWSTGLTETRHEDSQSAGGKGGGGTVTQVTYTYSSSFAVALAAREISSIGRVWADGKLLRDASGSLAVAGQMRVYTGAESQEPDPLIEATEGIGNVPAYRGMAYVVFEDLQLAEYANRIPNLTFEVIADAGSTVALSTVVGDLAARAGLQDFDVSGLAATVSGYVIGRTLSYRQAIEALARAYPFDGVEVDGNVVFAALPRSAVAALAEDDTMADGQDNDRRTVTFVRAQEQELPREVLVRHIDPARDYQPGLQRARRLAARARGQDVLDLPLVLSASAAKQAAEVALARAWIGRDRITFALTPRHLLLASGDVVTLTLDDGTAFEVQIEEVEFGGGRLLCRGAVFSAAVFASAAAGDSGLFPPQVIPAVPETTLRLLNLPPVTTSSVTEPVFFAAAASSGAGWRGAVLYQSTDGGVDYAQLASLAAPAVMGTCQTTLGDGPDVFWDEANSLTVTLLNTDMALESRPDLAVLNGANAALVGAEIIQFRTAVMDLDGNYVLSGLLRGRRGTEAAIAGHGGAEDFTLLTPSTVAGVAPGFSALGKDYLYKGVSVGATLADTTAQNFTYAGLNLMPFSPVHLRGVRTGTSDLTVTWVRRTRWAGDWLDGADVPLSEESESYEVDILDSGTVVRTLSSATPAVTYSAADQTTDFGAPQASVDVAVYQLSATMGRGAPAFATL